MLSRIKNLSFRAKPNLPAGRQVSRRIWVWAVIILLLGAVFLHLSGKSLATWYDDNFAYRQKITIGNTGAADANKKVKLDINTATLITAGKMQSDCDDTRFTDINGKQLQYFLDSANGACNTVSTDYWVLVPTINAGNTILYMYYGNPAAISGSQAAQFSQATFAPTSGPTAAAEEKGPGPVAMWHFDEGYGSTAQDSTINNNDGTLGAGSSAPTWTEESRCVSGKCLQFDGSNDYVSLGNDLFETQDAGSIEAWVNFNGAGNYAILDSSQTSSDTNSMKLFINANNLQFQHYIGSGSDNNLVRVNETMSTNTWYHVAVTSSGSSWKLYINGVDKTLTVDSGSNNGRWFNDLAIGTNAVDIGRFIRLSQTAFYSGKIDEVKLYPYARTAAQVKADYAARGTNKGSFLGGRSPSEGLSNGLVGYWKMDESSGNASDSSGNGNTLTNTNTATFTAGKFGNSASLASASSQYFTINDNATVSVGNQDFMISTWIYRNSTGATQGISCKCNQSGNGNEYRLLIYAPDTIGFQIDSNQGGVSTTSTTALSATGRWYFVVAWYDSVAKTVNVQVDNGAVNSTATGSSVPIDSALAFEVGRSDSGAYYFNGRIEEFRFYKRVLSGAERSQLYNFAPGPITHLKMDEGSGTTAQDSSGNAHTGTLNGNYSWKPGKYGKGVKLNGSSGDNVSVGDIGY